MVPDVSQCAPGMLICCCLYLDNVRGFGSQIYGVVTIIESGFLDGLPKDLVDKVAPALKENHSAVLKHPKVSILHDHVHVIYHKRTWS